MKNQLVSNVLNMYLMACQCSVFILERKKYITRCVNCIGKPINYNNPDEKPKQIPIKFAWYEIPTVYLRDHPNFTMGIELFLLFGHAIGIFIVYTSHFHIINYDGYQANWLGTFTKLIICFYLCTLIFYLNILDQLKKNPRYKLTKQDL